MKILQIIFKNSSTLDFTLPIFWDLKARNMTHEKHEIDILYWCLSKKEKIFSSPHSEALFKDFGIVEYTLADFPKYGTGPFVRLFRFLAGIIKAPVTPFGEAVKSIHFEAIIVHLIYKLFSVLKTAVEDFFIDHDRVFSFFNYDFLFFDNRSQIWASNLDKIFQWIDEKKMPVVLCPHAPHYINESDGFFPFIPGKVTITDYCQIWYTHKFSKPWLMQSKIVMQCKLVGYPGFDQHWIDYLKCIPQKQTSETILSVLVLGRKFYHEGIKKNEAEFVTLTFEEALEHLLMIKHVLGTTLGKQKYHIVYKPHPSSGLKLVEKILRRADFASFEIFTDLLYFALPSANIVISPYSTSLLIPCCFEIPVFLINSDLQELIGTHWDKVAQMYKGLAYFCSDEAEFKTKINELSQRISEKNSHDKEFLKQYFPEDSLERIRAIILDTEIN